MKTPRLITMLLLSTALAVPTLAQAQDDTSEQTDDTAAADNSAAGAATDEADQELPEISVPGGEIIVTGRRDRNVERSAPQVVTVLSTEDIARTGEGNIAGALGRVTGLSVVGNGYVYVRGLGDRYSLALLNGSPLPSPEPLKRVVPLDLFPSGLIASSLVQKSYSANYPGEFGGGVINLTTKAIPPDPYLSASFTVSGDTETTGQLGYTYYGSNADWLGYDGGARDIPPALQAFFDSGQRLSSGDVDTQAIASQLVNSSNSLVRRNDKLPANFSASLSGAYAWEIGDSELGIIASAGYSNKWTNKQPRQQRAGSSDLSTVESDFLGLTTENRVVANGMLGVGLEFGSNRIRWTNLIIRDTIKQARLSTGRQNQTDVDYMRQNTGWYERQLVDTQVVGEFKLTPDLSLDLRGGYANSQRNAPFEFLYEYIRTNSTIDPLGAYYVNRLNNGNGGDAHVTFSELDENLWSASADLSYNITDGFATTVGGAFSDTERTSSRREFQFLAPSICEGVPDPQSVCFPAGVTLFRPDYLLEPAVINAFNVELIESDEGNPAFLAKLRNYAGYGKVNWQITDAIGLDAGVRYEWARLAVDPIKVFNDSNTGNAGTHQEQGYWLPAATLTWQLQPELQVRLSASKTIARPQFRELINQPYYDPDSNRLYRGNPLLEDSQLYNAEARIEWYYAPEQRVTVSGFYKKIKNPIEAFLDSSFITSYANAPEASLFGGEFDVQKYFDLAEDGFFAPRRLVLIGNYTYTSSKLKVDPTDTTAVYGAFSTKASDFFTDGARLTGQSDHIVNLEIGLENQDKLSQQTFMITYASKRVISRGVFGTPPAPDVFEYPGWRLDFVAREGVNLFGAEFELKFEARNITGRRHLEVQEAAGNRIDVNSYDVGTSFALGISAKI